MKKDIEDFTVKMMNNLGKDPKPVKVQEVQPKAEEQPEPVPALPIGKEKKSSHIHLLIRPGTKEELQKLAKASGFSVNDLINWILEDYIKRKAEKE